MKQVAIIAAREVADGLRNRWILIVTVLMAGLALLLTLLGSAPSGTTRISALAVTVVSLSSLSIFFVPLIALLLSYDSITGEAERGTLMLLLAYPVARWEVVTGKFAGHIILLSIAVSIGYGSAGVVALSGDLESWADQAWQGFAGLIGSSVLLGAVFLALGLMISASVQERGTAAGLAIAIWLFFVLLYDLGLIGLLASGAGQLLDDQLVTALLLANPADVYRMLNLTGTSETAALSAMSGLVGNSAVSAPALTGLLCLWIAIPLSLACVLFKRRQL